MYHQKEDMNINLNRKQISPKLYQLELLPRTKMTTPVNPPKRKPYVKGFLLSLCFSLLLIGCTGIFSKNPGVIGKASVAEQKAKTKIEMVEQSMSKANVQRLDKIGEYSYGVDYTLNKLENTNEVKVAIDLNKRVQSLANQPTLDAMKEMQKIVNDLMTNNTTALLKKDKEISSLLTDVKDLNEAKQEAINKYIILADKNAALTDQYQATLKQMDSWGGMGAIWYGFKKLITRLAWGLGIFTVLFLVLRIASMSNPAAAGVFQIFNLMGSWLVHIIQVLVPKAVALAGNVSSAAFNAYKSTLTKVVDGIQSVRDRATAAGKTPSIEEVLDEVAKSMNEDEKAIVNEIKKALNWK